MELGLKFKGKNVTDLTDEEYFEFCTTVLNMEITQEEARELRTNSGKYAKIFNTEAPDIDFLEVMKQSMKDKPFIVRVPKEMDRNLLDKFTQITHDLALKALEDEDCNAVYIAYVKA